MVRSEEMRKNIHSVVRTWCTHWCASHMPLFSGPAPPPFPHIRHAQSLWLVLCWVDLCCGQLSSASCLWSKPEHCVGILLRILKVKLLTLLVNYHLTMLTPFLSVWHSASTPACSYFPQLQGEWNTPGSLHNLYSELARLNVALIFLKNIHEFLNAMLNNFIASIN